MKSKELNITYAPANELIPSVYNPRSWSEEATKQLTDSITRYGLVDPILVNGTPERKNIVIGGHFRLKVAKDLGIKTVPVVYINIPDVDKEKELNLRLNKNVGDWDYDLLADFDEAFLKDIGFSSEELDDLFEIEPPEEDFDLEKELKKLSIEKVEIQPSDIYELNGSRLMCGDSTNEADMLKLLDGAQADMCFTDPPYILAHLQNGGKKGGFGAKRNRGYMGTDSLPDNFTELWMANIAKVAKPDFHIIVYEQWKNLRTVWAEMEKYWKVKNMLVWHATNRSQGAAAKYNFYNKHDIAMVGSSEGAEVLNLESEGELLDNEYETALYAMSSKPQWEGYGKGKPYQPTDFIEHPVANAKTSGQSLVFGTKPLAILIPYIKVLTKRGDLIVEPFGGSGSTLIAAVTMERRCYLMEKNPVYAEVIKRRWEQVTGLKATKIYGND